MIATEKRIKVIEEELAVLDMMVGSLVELLTEKGLVSQEEWDDRVRARLAEDAKLADARKPPRRPH